MTRVIQIPGATGRRIDRFRGLQKLAESDKATLADKGRAAVFAQIHGKHFTKDIAREEMLQARERATLLDLYRPHLPETPTLNEMERIRADLGDTAAQIYYGATGNRHRIDREREARDAKIAELDAITDAARAEKDKADRAEFDTLTAEPRAGGQPFVLPGNMPPPEPPPEAA